MTKYALSSILVAVIVLLASGLYAADCINLDIELTPEVPAGETGVGSFELTNCGDLAGTVRLAFVLQIPDGPTIEIADVPVDLGAGETIAHSFTYPAPQALVGYTFGICITASLGEAVAHDCASTTIRDAVGAPEGGRENFGVALGLREDCLEVDLEISDVIYTSAQDFMAEAFFELTNCGDTEADIDLRLQLTGFDLTGASNFPVHVGAGETISRQWAFVVPPYVPSGIYQLCVTASHGTALAVDCETIEVRADLSGAATGQSISGATNYPNPFNPSTRIAFSLKDDAAISIHVVNLLGQRVRLLADRRAMAAGEQQVVWDGNDDSGQPVSSGIYFYRIIADDQTVSEKMILIK